MFTGFDQELIDFFWALKLNNNRPWFNAHKQTYVEKIYEPMKALTRDVCALMEQKYKLSSVGKCSRIYRDARRPQPNGPYRDCLWFVLAEQEHWSAAPTFYAEVSGAGLTYGFGSYLCTPAYMKNVRARMEANPAEIEGLIRAFARDKLYQVDGESYKRPKGSVSPQIDPWYNRKTIGFSAFEPWSEKTMGKQLPAYLTKRFGVLLPLYRWMWACLPPEA